MMCDHSGARRPLSGERSRRQSATRKRPCNVNTEDSHLCEFSQTIARKYGTEAKVRSEKETLTENAKNSRLWKSLQNIATDARKHIAGFATIEITMIAFLLVLRIWVQHATLQDSFRKTVDTRAYLLANMVLMAEQVPHNPRVSELVIRPSLRELSPMFEHFEAVPYGYRWETGSAQAPRFLTGDGE